MGSLNEYNSLFKYIDLFTDKDFGKWIIDRKNDGTMEHPFNMPFVQYSRVVRAFIKDVHDCCEESGVNNYIQILNENNIEWGKTSMNNADVSALSEEVILALLLGAVRAERFCDGALLSFLESGSIQRWLIELKER